MLRKSAAIVIAGWLGAWGTPLLIAATAPAVAPAEAANLRCEDWENPLGLDVAQPHLSWNLQSIARGERQTAYQILAASSAELLARDQGDLWDSGEVKSDQTIDVPYAGKTLASAEQIFWKVRVWDQERPATAVERGGEMDDGRDERRGLAGAVDWRAGGHDGGDLYAGAAL